MRLHELAKELRLTSKQIVAKCQDLGMGVKTHMATLEEDQVALIRQSCSVKPAAHPGKPTAKLSHTAPQTPATQLPGTRPRPQAGAAAQRSRATQAAASVARKRAQAGGPTAAAAIAARMQMARKTGAPPKAQGGATAAPAPTEDLRTAVEEPARIAEPPTPGVPQPKPAAPPSGRREPRQRKPDGKQPRGQAEAPLVVPTIEVMKIDERRGRRRGGKGRGKREVAPAEEGRAPGGPKSRIAPSFVLEEAAKKAKPKARPMRGAKKPAAPKVVRIQGDLSVGQFAEKINTPAAEIIRYLMTEHGQMLTVNQILPRDLMEFIALEFSAEVMIVPDTDEMDVQALVGEDSEATQVPRPPVVTVMGHVDHGKTTLLDKMRLTRVAEGEVGGITQAIGASVVDTKNGRIVFLDTPGHAAFTSMRARGARVTDIVVLVVAADDPLMPQAVEAINHAKEADVPIIVALNKVDLPGVNPQRLVNDLMAHGIVSEEQGGENMIVRVSAKKGEGLDTLLDTILLQAEMLELKANPNRNAIGAIIESKRDPQRGPVSTVLVQAGSLHIGDHFVVGEHAGRVKAMFDDKGKALKVAPPSTPVEILGLDGVPDAGEMFLVVPDERKSREISEARAGRRRARSLEERQHVTLENINELASKEGVKELRIILKADVHGSAEAVRQSLQRIIHERIKVRILHEAVGGITESDIMLADASDAIVIGFNVRPDPIASEVAQRRGVQIKTYQIIYDLMDEVKAAMVGMAEKRYREIPRGRAEVRQVFRVSKVGNVAGSYVASGEVARQCKARLLRDSRVIYDGQITNLKHYKEEVSKVPHGQECGISLKDYQDIKEGDIIEAYDLEEIPIVL